MVKLFVLGVSGFIFKLVLVDCIIDVVNMVLDGEIWILFLVYNVLVMMLNVIVLNVNGYFG